MDLKIYLFIVQYIVFCNQCVFIYGQNSRNAREGEFPFIVSISKINDRNTVEKNHVCAGVLISDKDVLTIKFCSQFFAVRLTAILVGTNNLRSASIHYPFWWITYERWADTKHEQMKFQDNELAIIRLTEAVSSTINPVVLQTSPNSQLYGSNVVTAGWGPLITGSTPTILRTNILHTITNVVCQQKINTILGPIAFEIDNNYLCTYRHYNPEDWYMVDYGSPILYNGELVAINQGSHPLPTYPPYPDEVNTHILLKDYSDFILDVKNNY